jgi:hypothetical protein
MNTLWHKAPPCASERSSDFNPRVPATAERRPVPPGGASLENRREAGNPSLTWRSRNQTGIRFPAETQRRRDQRREDPKQGAEFTGWRGGARREWRARRKHSANSATNSTRQILTVGARIGTFRAATVRRCEELRPQAGVGKLKHAPPMQANELPVVAQAVPPANYIFSQLLTLGARFGARAHR